MATGSGTPAVTLDLADGGAWLPSDATGVVAHLHGSADRADAAVTVPGAAGHRLDVVTHGPDLLITDETLDVVHLVTPQRLTPTRTMAMSPGSTVTAAVAETGDVYAVDAHSGRVQRLAGDTLAPAGTALELGRDLGATAQTEDGTLWVPVRPRGTLVAIRDGRATAHLAIAAPGDQTDVVLVGNRPVVVDATSAVVIPITQDHAERAIPLPSRSSASSAETSASATLPGGPSTASSDRASPTVLIPAPSSAGSVSAGSVLPIVEEAGGRLLLVDLTTRKIDQVALPPGPTTSPQAPSGPGTARATPGGAGPPAPGAAGLPDIDWPSRLGRSSAAPSGPNGPSAVAPAPVTRRLGPPVAHDGQIFVPDQGARSVWVFDAASRRFQNPIPVPETVQPRISVLVSGDQVWINDAAGPDAILVTPTARIAIVKQPPGLPGQMGDAPARPLPPPPSRPPARPDDAGGTVGTGDQGGAAGTGPNTPSSGRTGRQRPATTPPPGGGRPGPLPPSPVPQSPPPVPPITQPTGTPEPRPSTAQPEPTPTPSPGTVPIG